MSKHTNRSTPRGQVRFASNRFKHDSNVVIEVTQKFRLSDTSPQGGAVELPASQDISVTANITVKVWNRGMRYKLYKTNRTEWTGTDAYFINQHMLIGGSRLSTAGYGWPANELFEQHRDGSNGILADLMNVNGFFVSTHGEAVAAGSASDGIHDSYGYNPTGTGANDPTTLMKADDLTAATGFTATPKRTPPMNFCLIYSCWVALWSPIAPADAFNLKKAGTTFRDSGIFSFAETVYPLAMTKESFDNQNASSKAQGFHNHAQYLLDKMLLGYTAGAALALTNNAWVVVRPLPSGVYTDCGLLYVGDNHMTLSVVYHPDSEIGTDTNQPGIYRTAGGAYSPWFAIFPKALP